MPPDSAAGQMGPASSLADILRAVAAGCRQGTSDEPVAQETVCIWRRFHWPSGIGPGDLVWLEAILPGLAAVEFDGRTFGIQTGKGRSLVSENLAPSGGIAAGRSMSLVLRLESDAAMAGSDTLAGLDDTPGETPRELWLVIGSDR